MGGVIPFSQCRFCGSTIMFGSNQNHFCKRCGVFVCFNCLSNDGLHCPECALNPPKKKEKVKESK